MLIAPCLGSSNGLSDGFYVIEAKVNLLTDYSSGNNNSSVTIYVGSNNPYQTYFNETESIVKNINTTLLLNNPNITFLK